MGVRGGAHARLVGEQAAGHAVAHGFLDARADEAAGGGGGVERAHEDHLEGRENLGGVGDEHDEAAEQIERGHDRHDLFREGGDAAHAAEEHEGGERGDDHAHGDGRHGEGGLERSGDGVGLHHVADEAEGDDDRNGEEHRQLPAAEALGDVVGRAAGDVALIVLGLVGLGEHGFCEDGGHAEEGRDPHPEDGAGAAHGDGRGRSGEVAGADLRGDGRGEGLEGAHAVFARPFAVQGQPAERRFDHKAEPADLDEVQFQRKVDAYAAQQRNEAVHAPQKAVDVGYELSQLIHRFFPPASSKGSSSPCPPLLDGGRVSPEGKDVFSVIGGLSLCALQVNSRFF